MHEEKKIPLFESHYGIFISITFALTSASPLDSGLSFFIEIFKYFILKLKKRKFQIKNL